VTEISVPIKDKGLRMASNSGTESDLLKLYSARILALATEIPLTSRLAQPDASVRKRAPLCGSTVTVDLTLMDGLIKDFGQDVKACALGQASASILGQHVVGRSHADICMLRDQLSAMLKEDGPVPDAPFGEYEVLLPARAFGNRHASIMLAIEATLDAMQQLTQADCA
jgi:NifU-like protein involved in Fe-S cluster formation